MVSTSLASNHLAAFRRLIVEHWGGPDRFALLAQLGHLDPLLRTVGRQR